MDVLLRGDKFKFWIDEIVHNEKQNGLFTATLIPDIDSTFYPPWLIRTVHFPKNFLTKTFYDHYKMNLPQANEDVSEEFLGKVVQGGYYEVASDQIPNRVLPYIITPDNDIFGTRIDDTFQELNIVPMELSQGLQRLNNINHMQNERDDYLYCYCFNVGQGDSLLIIFPNSSVYIVDTNIYSEKYLGNYKDTVKVILQKHNLPDDKIKALIITHKHLDHLRGASDLIEKKSFNIEYFLMNFDYVHNTKVVRNLIDTASRTIPNLININDIGYYQEGNVRICIKNPGIDTRTKMVCPDINDSSITLSVTHGKNTLYLTGDTGSRFLREKLKCTFNSNTGENVLKVSHHGSCTGTDDEVIEVTNPKFAFISAGDHKRFNHPDCNVVEKLKAKIPHNNVRISKNIKNIVRYAVSMKSTKEYIGPFG